MDGIEQNYTAPSFPQLHRLQENESPSYVGSRTINLCRWPAHLDHLREFFTVPDSTESSYQNRCRCIVGRQPMAGYKPAVMMH